MNLKIRNREISIETMRKLMKQKGGSLKTLI